MNNDNGYGLVVFLTCGAIFVIISTLMVAYNLGKEVESKTIAKMCTKYGHTEIYTKEFDCSERK